jgi:hypothetical protein
MCTQYIRRTLICTLYIFSLIFVFGTRGNCQTNYISNSSFPRNFEIPHSFATITNVEEYFKSQDCPIGIVEFQGRDERYLFVKAYPYSGIDTTDLYCFVKRNQRWTIFAKAFLWKTPSKDDVSFRENGDSVEVYSKGVLTLKLRPIKGS